MAQQKARQGGSYYRNGAANGRTVEEGDAIGFVSRGGVPYQQKAIAAGRIRNLINDGPVSAGAVICDIVQRAVARIAPKKKTRVTKKKAAKPRKQKALRTSKAPKKKSAKSLKHRGRARKKTER